MSMFRWKRNIRFTTVVIFSVGKIRWMPRRAHGSKIKN